MKIKINIISFFISVLIFSNCHQTEDNKEKNNKSSSGFAVLAGKTAKISSKKINLGDTAITIFEDSSFFHKVFLNRPGFHRLLYGNKTIRLFMSPGDSLYLNLEKKNTSIKGIGAKANNFLQVHTELANSNSKFLDDNNKAVFSLELTDFKRKIDSLELQEKRLLEEFTERHPAISAIFKERLNYDIDYRHKRYRILYPHNYHRHHNFEKIANVGESYYGNIMKGSFNQPELLESNVYVRCVKRYLDALAVGKYQFQHLEFAPNERINARYQAILDLNANRYIKDFFLKEHLKKLIVNYSVGNMESCYREFKTDCENE